MARTSSKTYSTMSETELQLEMAEVNRVISKKQEEKNWLEAKKGNVEDEKKKYQTLKTSYENNINTLDKSFLDYLRTDLKDLKTKLSNLEASQYDYVSPVVSKTTEIYNKIKEIEEELADGLANAQKANATVIEKLAESNREVEQLKATVKEKKREISSCKDERVTITFALNGKKMGW